MPSLPVHIKHAGKIHDVELDTDQPPSAFKEAVFQKTAVPVDRMKVMVKGGVLKDDTDWKKVGPKAGQTFTVIGAAGELPKAPAKPVVFLEDMNDSELAEVLAKPVGLRNLGNTCYMNATVQAMRAIPELQAALSAPHSTITSSPLPKSLSTLYTQLSKTTDSVLPLAFLQTLRQVVPQFGELDRNAKGGMAGYAQQDAEECWGAILGNLKDVPIEGGNGGSNKKFVESYMMGTMRRELKNTESTTEPPTSRIEQISKIECNISKTTNFMQSGITDSLNSAVEKYSEELGRDAVYEQKSRIQRFPSYLTVQMVRFYWRTDIRKKAKIMRRVKFPLEFDALDLATPELKEKLMPVSRKMKEVEKERRERRKVRQRTKNAPAPGSSSKPPAATGDVEMIDASTASVTTATTTATETTEAEAGKGKEKVTNTLDLEDESVYREKEISELEALISSEIKGDVGCSESGLYDLVAIVTHKGAAADAGHYIGFVKKSVFHKPGDGFDEDDEDWYKFDDDKVSVFPKEKLGTLDGGGEDSSAYLLLYKTRPL